MRDLRIVELWLGLDEQSGRRWKALATSKLILNAPELESLGLNTVL